ncbi:MAG: type IX secretion system membrane protein PorP/SprF [Bacteroidia bacterium]|nr:type IX secretion system membrane protein PorP/SprF [Bacteroidia bacterium]
MVKKVASFLLFLFMFPVIPIFAQDPQFSQFYANPLYLNPALAGAPICPRLIANYRNQWPSVEKAFITYNASYDQYVDFLHGGVGLLFSADRAGGGNLNTTMISLMYAYKFNITSRIYASAALQATYYQRRLVWENLLFEDMIDPQSGFVLPTSEKQPDQARVGVPDFSAGVFIGYENLIYGGVSVSHITEPDIGFYADASSQLYMKITAHAGSVINLRKGGSFDGDKEFSISPNILYQQQFKYRQLNVGFYLTLDPFVGGLWFRHNFENADAIIPFLGVHYKNLRVGYSYDITISNLKGASGGAHEISASWQFPCIEKRRHIRAIKCPRF